MPLGFRMWLQGPQLHVSECDFRDLSCMFQNVTSGTSVACFRMWLQGPQLHVSECDFRTSVACFRMWLQGPQLHVSECDFRDLSCMFPLCNSSGCPCTSRSSGRFPPFLAKRTEHPFIKSRYKSPRDICSAILFWRRVWKCTVVFYQTKINTFSSSQEVEFLLEDAQVLQKKIELLL